MNIAIAASILYAVLVVSFALRMWAKRRVFAGSILALGPGPETGAMYGIEQFVSGLVGGFFGLLIGPILGGTSGWAFSAWRARERH